MIYVGIDVAKDKHDCFITDSDGEILFPVFTIQNNRDGFDDLFAKILPIMSSLKSLIFQAFSNLLPHINRAKSDEQS